MMNHQRKRKFLQEKSPSVKKFKVDLKKDELLQNKKTESLEVTKRSDIKQNKLEAKSRGNSGKRKQWQSVKEKRKRLKKKHLMSKSDAENCDTTIVKDASNSVQSEASTIPKNSEEYSSNWKNLAKAMHISSSKKRKNKKKADISETKEAEDSCKEPEIWFDDVDEMLLDRKPEQTKERSDKLVKQESFTGVTKDIAMDCEMVGVGWDGKDNQLARVSIVNHYGHCILDKFVRPKEKVVDYRTHVSGIRPEDLEQGEKFEDVQKAVGNMMKDRVLIGHAIHNDLKVLYISHPKSMIRDTSRYKPFRQMFDGRNPSLKKLTAKVLGVSVQEGEHNSIQDAQAAMRLYTMHRKQWEKDMKNKVKKKKKLPTKKKKLKNK